MSEHEEVVDALVMALRWLSFMNTRGADAREDPMTLTLVEGVWDDVPDRDLYGMTLNDAYGVIEDILKRERPHWFEQRLPSIVAKLGPAS